MQDHNPASERFRRRSFLVFAFLVTGLVIGVLETARSPRLLPTAEDRAMIERGPARTIDRVHGFQWGSGIRD